MDVVSTIDLGRMVQAHEQKCALATLAVQQRDSSRQLLFDEQMQLCGRRAGRDAQPEMVRTVQRAASAGIFRHSRDFAATCCR